MTEREALKLALEALELTANKFQKQREAITAIKEALAQPEFIKHNVEQPYDWSEWVCPDPKGYLMQCCDCGLVHEAQFGVVRYKSETEREDCDTVDDPNLQAVFRMRRSEQWSPKDTAYRPGGLAQPEQIPPSAYSNTHQPEQEQIQPDKVCIEDDGCPTEKAVLQRFWREHQKTQPEQERNALPKAMNVVIAAMQADPGYAWSWHCNIAMAYVDEGVNRDVANQGAARFMKLLANVEPAHDILPTQTPDTKLKEQEPVAWRGYNWGHSPDDWVYRDFDDPILDGNGNNVGQPLYTTPPQRTWVGLTDEDLRELGFTTRPRWWPALEAKLKEKNT